MTHVLHWLPSDALRSKRTAQPFADAVADWSESWLVDAGGWSAAAAFCPATPDQWSTLRQEGSFELLGRPKAMLDLALALVGQQARANLTANDLRLLRRLAGRALDDLHARLEGPLPPAAIAIEAAGGAVWHLMVGPPKRPMLAIAVSEPALAAVARTAFPGSRKKATLTAPREAAQGARVPVAGRIGTARLSIEQIDALQIGDILVLDERADAPAQLTVAGAPSNLFFAIGDVGDRLTLTMQE